MSVPQEIAHYWCEETSGVTAEDQSASENDMALQGGRTLANLTGTGKLNNAFFLDGANDYFTPSQFVLGTTYTFAAWLNIPDQSSYYTLFGSNAGLQGYLIYRSISGVWGFYTETDINGDVCHVETGDCTGLHYFVITRNVQTVTIYKDNVQVGTCSDLSADGNALTVDRIGWGYNNSTANRYKGMMDDIRFFNVVLGEQYRTALYNGGSGSQQSLAQLMGVDTGAIEQEFVPTICEPQFVR